jgi:hypothetical protein
MTINDYLVLIVALIQENLAGLGLTAVHDHHDLSDERVDGNVAFVDLDTQEFDSSEEDRFALEMIVLFPRSRSEDRAVARAKGVGFVNTFKELIWSDLGHQDYPPEVKATYGYVNLNGTQVFAVSCVLTVMI